MYFVTASTTDPNLPTTKRKSMVIIKGLDGAKKEVIGKNTHKFPATHRTTILGNIRAVILVHGNDLEPPIEAWVADAKFLGECVQIDVRQNTLEDGAHLRAGSQKILWERVEFFSTIDRSSNSLPEKPHLFQIRNHKAHKPDLAPHGAPAENRGAGEVLRDEFTGEAINDRVERIQVRRKPLIPRETRPRHHDKLRLIVKHRD